MTLEEFIKECLEDVEEFRSMWEAGIKKQPQGYPRAMNPGDWFDQFLAFLDSRRA